MRLVLLGDPVAHSRSPAIHEAALAACGIEGRYTARRVDEQGVYRAVAEVRAGALDGANVTMPHKAVAAAACDRLSVEAARCRSVNTIARRDGEATGWSTDVSAIAALAERLGLDEATPALVLGAGGTAAAALVALGGRSVRVAARRLEAAVHLTGRLGIGDPVEWGTAVPGCVVVNATPLGMRGEPLPPGIVEACSGLLDLPYGPSDTPAVAAARDLGIPALDGIDLLVAQAAESFRLWTGSEAPVAVMEAAARS